LWPAYGKVAGFDASKIINVYMGGAAYVPSLMAGKVDATSAWLVNLPAYQKAAAQAGLSGKLGTFLWADYGLQLYGSVVIASDQLIESNSDLVRRYTRAAMRGFTYAINHPQEGIDAWMKYNTGRAREVIEGEFRLVLKLAFDKLFEKNGLGYADPGKMKNSVALVNKYLGLKGALNSRDTFTNEFIEATPRAWRFAFPVRSASIPGTHLVPRGGREGCCPPFFPVDPRGIRGVSRRGNAFLRLPAPFHDRGCLMR
jgi:NitT/TauT family transport system substrate-binding protein